MILEYVELIRVLKFRIRIPSITHSTHTKKLTGHVKSIFLRLLSLINTTLDTATDTNSNNYYSKYSTDQTITGLPETSQYYVEIKKSAENVAR